MCSQLEQSADANNTLVLITSPSGNPDELTFLAEIITPSHHTQNKTIFRVKFDTVANKSLAANLK